MTATMQTLAAWLLEQIAADEAMAHRWQAAMDADENEPHSRGIPAWVIMAGGVAVPARVLAVCEAHRRIVQACEPIYGTDGWEYDDAPELAWTTLRALAAIYADRDGFREEWR